MNEPDGKPQAIGNGRNDGKGFGGRCANFLSLLGIVLLCILLFGIPVLALFLGQCWVIAWMVARFFL